MIEQLMAFSIRNKLIIMVLTLALILTGIYSLSRLPIDAVPDITDNQVQVITPAPELSAQEVERLITYPIELSMGYIPGVETIRSISRFGLSVITIVFREDVDIYWAREQINQKMATVRNEVPEELGVPQIGPLTTGLGEIYQYVVYAGDGYESQYDNYELRTIQDWIIKRQLTGLEGVVEVNSSGGFLKQYEIAVTQDKLKAYRLTIRDLFTAVEKNNQNAGGSYIEREDYTYFIRGEGLARNEADLRQIVVKVSEGVPILLGQVADINIGQAPRFGAMTMNGRGEVVAGQVLMLKGENSMKVVQRVKERMEEIKASLPEGILIEPYLDRSKLVNRTTRTVSKNLIEGALIVIFILVLFLGNFRAGLIVASVIPLSMLFAVTMMRLFGVSANLMSLGALDFGLIVDGAVIIVEAVLHRLGVRQAEGPLNAAEKESEIAKAAQSIRKSAAFGEVIILIVYIPILFLRGVEGKMFIPMAQTVSFAIFGALILSMTYVPMMSAAFLRNSTENPRSLSARIMGAAYNLYRPILNVSMRLRYIVLITTALVFGLSLFQLSRMGGEFIPTLEEGDFALHQILPTGSSLQKGVEVSAELQNILLSKFPEVEKVVTKIGTAEIPTDIMPLEAGDIYVILKPKAEWTSAKTREDMFDAMEKELEKYPGVFYEFTQPIQMRFNELMTGVRQDIAVMIYGEDLGVLAQLADRSAALISTMDGVGDVKVEATTGLQQMVVRYDRLKLAKYGLNIADVNDILQTAFAGKVAGHLYEGERRFDIVVRLKESERQNIESLQQMMVSLPGGGYVPLSELASVGFEEGPAQISRHDTKRRITVGVNTRDMDVATVVDGIKSIIGTDLDLPAGYYVRYGGQFENLERARSTLSLVVPIALGLILILLYFTFRSVILALLIFTAIPLSAVGGIWALCLRDMPFSISAGVGFIALFGVAVLNGIVLISAFNDLKKSGMQDVNNIIKTGTKERLRPVLLTAAVASLGFLPMALSRTAGAEVQRPLATVVIGGLITATALTLFILPILYSMLHRYTQRSKEIVLGVVLVLLAALPSQSHAQTPAPTSLEDFLEYVWDNSELTEARQLQLNSLNTIRDKPFAPQPLGITARGEEFNFAGLSGIQSLDLTKSFYLPGRLEAYQKSIDAQVQTANAGYEVRRLDINAALIDDFLRTAWLQSQLVLENERLEILQGFLLTLQKKSQSGQTGNLDVEVIEADMAGFSLQRQNVANELQTMKAQLMGWSGMQALTLPPLELLTTTTENYPPLGNHPKLTLNNSRKLLSESAYEKLAANNLPLLRGGTSLQSVDGSVLFFGAQVGINIPLAKGYLDEQRTSRDLTNLSIDAETAWLSKSFGFRRSRLISEIANLDLAIESLRTGLLTDLENVLTRLKEAFIYGEAELVEIRKANESLYNAKSQLLKLQYDRLSRSYQLTYYLY